MRDKRCFEGRASRRGRRNSTNKGCFGGSNVDASMLTLLRLSASLSMNEVTAVTWDAFVWKLIVELNWDDPVLELRRLDSEAASEVRRDETAEAPRAWLAWLGPVCSLWEFQSCRRALHCDGLSWWMTTSTSLLLSMSANLFVDLPRGLTDQ